jgi:hypothetical protein
MGRSTSVAGKPIHGVRLGMTQVVERYVKDLGHSWALSHRVFGDGGRGS